MMLGSPHERLESQRRGIHRLGAVLRAQAHRRGQLWLRARARRSVGLQGPALLRPLLLRAQGRGRQDRRGGLEDDVRPDEGEARGGPRGDRHRAPHHLSQPLQLPDRGRDAGARRRRRADGAARGAQEEARRGRPVRSGAQAAAAVPAGGDRRRHLAHRGRDPRHSAPPRRSLSAPRHRLAGQGAGRRLGRAGRGGHQRLQRAAGGRPHPETRPHHRGARRRLAGRPMVVQRGDRGARRGGQHDPAHFRGRPRDRRHADRFRLRQARADPDRRRRDGGAGARRPDRRPDEQGAPRAGLLAARPGGPAQRAARAGARVAEGPAGGAAPGPRRSRQPAAARAARQRADSSHAVLPRRRAAVAAAPRRPGRAPPAAARRRDAPALHRAQDLSRHAAHAHLARARPRHHDRGALTPRGARFDSGARGAARPLLSTAARVLLSERAGARLRAGARQDRSPAARGCFGEARHAARHRVLRRLRRRDRRGRAHRAGADREPPVRALPASWRPPQEGQLFRRSRPGQFVRRERAVRTRPPRATPTSSAIRAASRTSSPSRCGSASPTTACARCWCSTW